MGRPRKSEAPEERNLSPLAANIVRLRRERRWSQGELATRIGVNISHIARIEIGVSTPSADIIAPLMAAFGVTADELMVDLEKLPPDERNMFVLFKTIRELSAEERSIVATVADIYRHKRNMTVRILPKPRDDE